MHREDWARCPASNRAGGSAKAALHLVTRSPDPTGIGRTRLAQRWKPVIHVFAIIFGERYPAAETYQLNCRKQRYSDSPWW